MIDQHKIAKVKLQERELIAQGFKKDFKETLDRQQVYNISNGSYFRSTTRK